MYWSPKGFQKETWTCSPCQAMWKPISISSPNPNQCGFVASGLTIMSSLSLTRDILTVKLTRIHAPEHTILMQLPFRSSSVVQAGNYTVLAYNKSQGEVWSSSLWKGAENLWNRTSTTWKVPTSLTFKTSMLMSRQFIAATGRVTSEAQAIKTLIYTLGLGGWEWICLAQIRRLAASYSSFNHHNNPPPWLDTWCTRSMAKKSFVFLF